MGVMGSTLRPCGGLASVCSVPPYTCAVVRTPPNRRSVIVMICIHDNEEPCVTTKRPDWGKGRYIPLTAELAPTRCLQ
jgi:hypothetical protein